MSDWPLPSTDYRYGHICPDCLGLKHPQSAKCWACRVEFDVHDAAYWARRSCPDCGAAKHRDSVRCRDCANAAKRLAA